MDLSTNQLNISSHPAANSTMTIQDLQNECLDLRKSVSPSMSSTSGSSRLQIASDDEDELDMESGDMYSSSIHGDLSSRSSSATSSNLDYPYIRYRKRNSSGDSLDQYNFPGVPVVYHQNMARTFPGSENRTPEQQEQRHKNTVAARYSRAKAKMMENMVELESVEAKRENFTSKRNVAARNVYANMLMRLLGKDDVDWSARWAKTGGFV